MNKIGLALQGGGSHGAFSWGVLDRLLELEENELGFDSICGTSAGAINAVVMTYGMHIGGRMKAKELLEKMWLTIANKGGFKILRFNNLVQKLQTVNLAASYVDDKKWPEVSIHERGNPKNKLLTVRMKIENKPTKKNPDALYIRNYIEKESLLEKLTEYRRASWDEAGGVSTADLDQQLKKPRLRGPGAKAAQQSVDPKTDIETLGRKKR